MPYHLTWEPKGLIATFTGVCSIDDARRAYEQIGADPRFDDLQYQIFDFLGVTDQDVTEEQVEEIVGLDFAHFLSNPEVIHVQVSNDPRIDHLIALYIRQNANPERQHHCNSLAQARAWIRAMLGPDMA